MSHASQQKLPLHPPLVCKRIGVNEFITLLRAKCTYCQVFLTVCDSAASPVISFGKSWFVSSSHTFLPYRVKKTKKQNVIFVDFRARVEGRLPVFAFLLDHVCFFFVFTRVNWKIPSPEDDSSYDFTVWILLL